MKRASKEFRRRFMKRVDELALRYKEGVIVARRTYEDYVEFIGETSDGSPEDDADYFIEIGGV